MSGSGNGQCTCTYYVVRGKNQRTPNPNCPAHKGS